MAFVNEDIEYNLFGFGTIRHICCIVGKRIVIVPRRFSDSQFGRFRLSKIRRYGTLSFSTPVQSKLIAPGSKSLSQRIQWSRHDSSGVEMLSAALISALPQMLVMSRGCHNACV